MHPHLVIPVIAATLLLPGCAKKTLPAAAASATAPPTTEARAPKDRVDPAKQARCEAAADELGAFGAALGAVLIEGLSEGEADNELATCLTRAGDTSERAACLTEDQEEAIAACLTWPDDVIACIAAGDLFSGTCQEAFRDWQGIAPAPGPASPGAGPLWRAQLHEDVFDAIGTADGGVVAISDTRVTGFDAQGRQRWQHREAASARIGWLAAVDGGRVVVWADLDDALHLVDAATGEEQSSIPLDDVAWASTVHDDTLWITVDNTAGRVVIDGSASRFEPVAFDIDLGRGLSPPDHLRVDDAGRVWVTWWLDGQVAVFDADGAPVLAIAGSDVAGPPTFEGREAFVVVDGDVLVMRADQCRWEGLLYAPDEVPKGCLAARHRLNDAASWSPTLTEDGLFVVGEDVWHGVDRASGTRRFKQMLDGGLVGPLYLHDDRLVAIETWTFETPTRLVRLHPASGAPLVASPVADHSKSLLHDAFLVRTPTAWLVVDGEQLVAFPLDF